MSTLHLKNNRWGGLIQAGLDEPNPASTHDFQDTLWCPQEDSECGQKQLRTCLGSVAGGIPEHFLCWNYELSVIWEYFWVHRNKVFNSVNHYSCQFWI